MDPEGCVIIMMLRRASLIQSSVISNLIAISVTYIILSSYIILYLRITQITISVIIVYLLRMANLFLGTEHM